VVFRIPDVIDGRAATLHVRLALLPLLAGHVRPTAVRVEQLAAELHVEPRGGGDAFEAYRATMGPVVEALIRHSRGMTVSLTDSQLHVMYAGRRLVALSELAGEAMVISDAITLDLSSAADLWRKAQGKARITAGSLAASATASSPA
jgi:hypothetical protein